jgi:hypothetical protein
MKAHSEDTAHWDVALEALLNERYQKSGQALSLLELKRLSGRYAVRLDDILDTLCKLHRHGIWAYLPLSGGEGEPDVDMCRLLKANHRLDHVQLERLGGSWRPA